MGVQLRSVYVGDHLVESHHGPTGTRIRTDLPADHGGKARTFSPTDLYAVSLASCILTIMGMAAAKDGVDLQGTAIEFTKEMRSDPRRVDRVEGKVVFPESVPADKRRKYMECVRACPVHRSLHPEIQVALREA